jgi:hypothetical protein
MNTAQRQAVHRQEDDELLGFVQANGTSWDCQTVFGYTFATQSTAQDAISVVKNKGLEILMGTWEHYDGTTDTWLPCVLIEAATDSVRIAYMDGFYPDTSKTYLLTQALPQVLRK